MDDETRRKVLNWWLVAVVVSGTLIGLDAVFNRGAVVRSIREPEGLPPFGNR